MAVPGSSAGHAPGDGHDGSALVLKDVSFSTIFYGVLPFVVTDIIRLAILIAFPIIALYLPSRM